MALPVYVLGVIVTLTSAVLLARAYSRTGLRLLLWSAVCFAGLTIANALVIADLIVFPDVELYSWRLATGAVSMLVLLFGLVWESD